MTDMMEPEGMNAMEEEPMMMEEPMMEEEKKMEE